MKKWKVISILIVVLVIFLMITLGIKSLDLFSEKSNIRIIENSRQLDNLIHSKDDSLIYFGRPTCPDCEDFYPILLDSLIKNDTIAYYYNSDVRIQDTEYLAIKSYFEIDWVPSLYRVGNGEIIKKFDLLFVQTTDAQEIEKTKRKLDDFLNGE